MKNQEIRDFIKVGDGFVLGTFYLDGQIVRAHPKQVAYLIAPFGDSLRASEAEAPAPASPSRGVSGFVAEPDLG